MPFGHIEAIVVSTLDGDGQSLGQHVEILHDFRIAVERRTINMIVPVTEKGAVSVAVRFDRRRDESPGNQSPLAVNDTRTAHRNDPSRRIDPFVTFGGDRQRFLALAHVAADADFQGRRSRQIEIHVRPVIIAVVAVIVVVIEVFGLF